MANKWLRKQIPNVKIISMETNRYLKDLTQALSLGSKVLFEVGDEISRKLFPIFKLSKEEHRAGKNRTVILES